MNTQVNLVFFNRAATNDYFHNGLSSSVFLVCPLFYEKQENCENTPQDVVVDVFHLLFLSV